MSTSTTWLSILEKIVSSECNPIRTNSRQNANECAVRSKLACILIWLRPGGCYRETWPDTFPSIHAFIRYTIGPTIRYTYTPEEFNVDSKTEYVQLNLAHVAIKNIKKEELKQTNASAHLVQYRFKIREGSPEGIRETTEERICQSRLLH